MIWGQGLGFGGGAEIIGRQWAAIDNCFRLTHVGLQRFFIQLGIVRGHR